VFGALAIGGAFVFYVAVWVTPRQASGELDEWVRAVVDGRASAPYQYRVLVPAVLVWLADHASMSMAQATIVVDGVALAVGTAIGFYWLRRSDRGLFVLPAAVYCGYLTLGLLFFAKPETITAFAATTAVLLALDGDARRAVDAVALVVGAAVLVGCRTDLLGALAVGFAVRWWQRRRAADAAAGAVLAIAAAVATAALSAHYAAARYPAGVGIVQLDHNFAALPVVVAASFLAPALGPLVLARQDACRDAIVQVVRDDAPLLAVVVAELAFSMVFGRIDEVRLLFPVAFALAVAGIDLWRAVARSIATPSSPLTSS